MTFQHQLKHTIHLRFIHISHTYLYYLVIMKNLRINWNFKALSSITMLAGWLMVCSVAWAQNQSFVVMATSSSGTVQYSDGAAWKNATSGVKLATSNQVKVDANGYVCLVMNGSKTFELKQPGVYRLADLATKYASASSSSRYVQFMLNQSSHQKGNNMEIPGAVERSLAPTPFSPRNSYVIEDVMTFAWQTIVKAPKDSYDFEITDLAGGVVHSFTTNDTFVVLNLKNLNLVPNECYYWQVSNSKSPTIRSEEFCFKVYGESDRNNILKDKAVLEQDLQDETGTAIGHMILATFYRQKNVSYLAMSAYEKAIHLAPHVALYRETYAKFLEEIGLAEYAKRVRIVN
jgi:hypothetical protein